MLHKGETLIRILRPLCLFAAILGATLTPSVATAADPPIAATEDASAIGNSSATLNGKVNPQGSTVSVCRFEYGTTSAYGAALPCTPASLGTGGFNVAVSVDLTSLEAATTYHYRLIASSIDGANQGADRTFTTTGAPACPNAARRLEQGILAIQLPDCMALEQVSPSVKYSQRAAAPVISADGRRVAFKSLAALADTPGNLDAFAGDRYVSTRGEDGWIPAPTSPPSPYADGWERRKDLTRSYDPSLTRWLLYASGEAGSPVQFGIGQLFRGGLGGIFEPVSPLLEPIDPSVGRSNVELTDLQGASADHRKLFISPGDSKAVYLPDDPVPSAGFDKSVYQAQLDADNQPSVKLLTRDETGPDAGKVWGGKCGARIGGITGQFTGWRNQGAVSADGSRVYFSTRAAQLPVPACNFANKFRIMERTETAGVAEIEELIVSECTRVAPACKTEAELNGDDLFSGASVDGTKVYFATNRQLADSDLDGGFSECSNFFAAPGCDLYLYDSEADEGERLTQVSAGEVSPGHPTVGEGADVYNGTVAISGDGSHVYFAAAGVLTPSANPDGKTADEYPAEAPKLYVWDTDSEDIRFIGIADPLDFALWGGRGTFLGNAYPVPATGKDGFGNEVGGRGDVLIFQTRAALTSEDADGTYLDTFRYDAGAASPTLECVSCKPGGPDAEPLETTERGPGIQQVYVIGTAFAEENRWVSEDGDTVLIRTNQALLSADVNGARNDYLWRDGELTLLPGTTPPASPTIGDYPPVLSHDGSMVAFTAYSPLLPSDGDTNSDVYVARPGGGFPFPRPEQTCVGEACQGGPPQRPGEQSAASETARSFGNVVSSPRKKAKRCAKGKRKVTKKGKTRCVKVSRKKSAKTRKSAQQRAKHNQGGQK
jgi:hypothetical protein